MPSIDQLWEEARALTRPSLHLHVRDGSRKAAASGTAVWRPESLQRYPWTTEILIAVDCEWFGTRLPNQTRFVSVAYREDAEHYYHIEHRGANAFEGFCTGGVLLDGFEYPSIPPLEALCLYGGDRVAEWLRQSGLERIDYAAARELPLGRKYVDRWLASNPRLQRNQPVAVMGGWHELWPDDLFYSPLECRLVVLTLRDAEPWVELLAYRGGNLVARAHCS